MSEDFSAAEPLLAEYADIEAEMAGPAAADPGAMRRLGRRYAELGRVVAAYRAWQTASADLADARELAVEDEDFAAEVPALEAAATEAGEHLREVLVPRDPDDARDVIIEVKAGEGGEESALFASDLARMYSRYAERQGWAVEVLDATDSDLGGYKDVRLAIKTRGPVEPQDGVWAHLKYEGGVHRVQRVPVTESQGRIHTSAAGVLVMPEADDPGELQIDAADLRIDVFRSSGPGGQSVNTTDSAVRITHLPSGSSCRCRTRSPSCRTRKRPCGSCGPGSWPSERPPLPPRPRRPVAVRCALWTAPSESAPTISLRTGSPTTAPASRPTTSMPCSTVTLAR